MQRRNYRVSSLAYKKKGQGISGVATRQRRKVNDKIILCKKGGDGEADGAEHYVITSIVKLAPDRGSAPTPLSLSNSYERQRLECVPDPPTSIICAMPWNSE